MKGLLYCNFSLCKKWFMAAGIFGVIGTTACMVCRFVMGDDQNAVQTTEFAFVWVQIITLAISEEWLGRNLEANIKNRFADYVLSGMSKKIFVLSELVKNLITMGIGFTICLIMQLAMNIADPGCLSFNSVKILFIGVLFVGVFDWIIEPVIIALGSAEKAGLAVGGSVGFLIVLPLMLIIEGNMNNNETTQLVTETIIQTVNKPWFVPMIVALLVCIYAGVYLIFLKRVKKGDVCR